MNHLARKIVIFVAVAATAGSPAVSQACWFKNLFGCCGRTTYRPLFSSGYNACSPCAQQTCQYVPQTCFRNVCVNVPVTCCRPVTTCDPCTGCPTTVMRPFTTLVRQVRRVPYTTWRLAPATNCCSTSAVSYSGSAPGCNTCGTGSVMGAAPVIQLPESGPVGGPVESSPLSLPGPGESSSSDAAGGQTYYEGSSRNYRVQPAIPDAHQHEDHAEEAPQHAAGSDLQTNNMPVLRGWTARRTLQRDSLVRPAQAVQELAPQAVELDNQGWKPSNR